MTGIKIVQNLKESESSIHPEVAKKLAITENRLDKEKAVLLADEGRGEEAAKVLRRRAFMNASLPIIAKSKLLEEENEGLAETAKELEEKKSLSSSSRKQIQYENYQDKYQKR